MRREFSKGFQALPSLTRFGFPFDQLLPSHKVGATKRFHIESARAV
jgi:hypothetical protein